MSSARRHVNDRPNPAGSPEEAVLRLFGRGSVYTLVLGMQMLSGFLVLPVLTRLLAPAAYGQSPRPSSCPWQFRSSRALDCRTPPRECSLGTRVARAAPTMLGG